MTTRNRKTAAVIVTYYPSNVVLDQIDFTASCVDHVIVVDNTPGQHSFIRKLLSANVTCHYNLFNFGLSKALNDGIQLSGQMGYEDCFLFDQDSRPDASFFSEMIRFKSELERKVSNCAFCVPDFFDRNSRSRARFPILSRFSFRHVCCPNMQAAYPGKALIAITSGTLISYERFLQIGTLKEEYFIDFIDNEYCLRAAEKGFTVGVNCSAVLNHAIGVRLKKYFLGVPFKPNNHPPIRRYYISRNGIKTAFSFLGPFKAYFFLILLRLLHESLSILLFEKKKLIKLKALMIGCIDGVKGKMGPCGHDF